MPVDPATRHRIGYGTAPADELARIVASYVQHDSQRYAAAALAELAKRASPERERSRLLGRLAALDGRDGTVTAIIGALEYTAATSELEDRRAFMAGDQSSAPLYKIASELRRQLDLSGDDCPSCGAAPAEPCRRGAGATGDGMTSCR